MSRFLPYMAALALLAGCVSPDAEAPAAARKTAPKPALKTLKVMHNAVGAAVYVSSTHEGQEGEGPAAALVDSDLRTRWSSEYAEPQEVVLQLTVPATLSEIRLHWETAAAAKYKVSISDGGKEWTMMKRGVLDGLLIVPGNEVGTPDGCRLNLAGPVGDDSRPTGHFAGHTEGSSVESVLADNCDGMEIYNIHSDCLDRDKDVLMAMRETPLSLLQILGAWRSMTRNQARLDSATMSAPLATGT